MATPLAVKTGETEPHGVPEHDTVQATPLLAPSLVTVAGNCAVEPACTVAVLGVTDTVMGGGVELPPPVQDEHANTTAPTMRVNDLVVMLASKAFIRCSPWA